MAHHGNTPAAWTAVTIATLGFVVGGVGLMLYSWPTFWVGVAMQPIALIAGKVLALRGYGVTPRAGTSAGH